MTANVDSPVPPPPPERDRPPQRLAWLGTVLSSTRRKGQPFSTWMAASESTFPPTTLGPLALAACLVPGRATRRGSLRGRWQGLPQPSKEPLHPSLPLPGVHRGGSVRNLYLVSEPPDQSVTSIQGRHKPPLARIQRSYVLISRPESILIWDQWSGSRPVWKWADTFFCCYGLKPGEVNVGRLPMRGSISVKEPKSLLNHQPISNSQQQNTEYRARTAQFAKQW